MNPSETTPSVPYIAPAFRPPINPVTSANTNFPPIRTNSSRFHTLPAGLEDCTAASPSLSDQQSYTLNLHNRWWKVLLQRSTVMIPFHTHCYRLKKENNYKLESAPTPYLRTVKALMTAEMAGTTPDVVIIHVQVNRPTVTACEPICNSLVITVGHTGITEDTVFHLSA